MRGGLSTENTVILGLLIPIIIAEIGFLVYALGNKDTHEEKYGAPEEKDGTPKIKDDEAKAECGEKRKLQFRAFFG